MKARTAIVSFLLFSGGLVGGIFSSHFLNGNDKTETISTASQTTHFASDASTATEKTLIATPAEKDLLTQLDARLKQEIAHREELETQLAKLELRVELLDSNRSLTPEPPLDSAIGQGPQIPPAAGGLNAENLIASGVNADTANELVAHWNRYQLEQLELRDTAAREGWLNSEQFRERASALQESRKSLREEIGDDKYDRYLYESGDNNRVAVNSVIAGSAAESIGLRSGDIIIAYAGSRTFSGRELQNATRDGSRSETVTIELLRDGESLELSVPRGPLGIMLDAVRLAPD
ncbi:MAG: PDZ domain-containing protein [Gammaproteobacteria bacterium]|nr:PDZ domain-containing protein [Gammaproteobacteria bacterium]